jgi:two-component system nitrogen regulation response regulator GlnG
MPLLIQHYLRRFNRELSRYVEGISPEASDVLKRHSWPGNVRELQSVLKQALLQATGTVLVPDFLPAAVSKQEARTGSTDIPVSLEQFMDEKLRGGTENLYEETLRRMEKLLLTRVLQHTGGNQVQAAKILGITRGSLRTKIRDLGIIIAKSVASSEDLEE